MATLSPDAVMLGALNGALSAARAAGDQRAPLEILADALSLVDGSDATHRGHVHAR